MNLNQPDLNEFVWCLANAASVVVNAKANECFVATTTPVAILGPTKQRATAAGRRLMLAGLRTWIRQNNVHDATEFRIQLRPPDLNAGEIQVSWTNLGILTGRDHTTIIMAVRQARMEMLADVERELRSTFGYGDDEIVVNVNE